MRDLIDGWKMEIASNLDRDALVLELVNPSGDVVAEVVRWDSLKTVTVNTFGHDIPLVVLELYCDEAYSVLDPFEDGTSFTDAGIVKVRRDA